jgi:membrane-associated phospholipid phosphatase
VTTLSALLAAALWLARHRRAAVAVLVVRAVAVVASSGLKVVLDRPRPHFVVAVSHASGAAFPSGHALGSAALWGTAAVLVCRQLKRWWAVALAVVVPVLVGVSRVLLGVHWPSDVLAGLCLGWVVAVVATDLLRPARDGPLEWRPLSDRR